MKTPLAIFLLTCTLTSRYPSFTLTQNPKCRALITANHSRLCLSEELWLQWLSLENPPQICGELTGEWRLSSPLALVSSPIPKKVISTFHIHALPNFRGQVVSSSWLWLQRTREKLSQQLKPIDTWGIYRAMVLGERSADSPQSFLRLIGFFHLLNASGVHLCALAIFIGLISERVLRSALIPAPLAVQISRSLTLLSWLWAWALCGCRLGMLRPVFVSSARLSSQSLGFKWRYWTPFALSMALELIIAIYATGTPFFSESRLEVALAVGGFLMAVQGERSHWLALLAGWIFVALAQAYHTQSISLSAPILGFLTLPLFCSVSYPLVISGLTFLHPVGSRFLQASLWVLEKLVRCTLTLPSLWVLPRYALIVALISGLLWITFSFALQRWMRFWVLLSLFAVVSVIRLHSGQSKPVAPLANEVIQLDVGQGDSALVLSGDAGHAPLAGLIDVGSAHSLNDAQWLQVFSQEGITRIAWVGLTHLDEDHVGGLERLSRLVPIGCVASSSQEVWSERGQKMAQRLLARGIRLESWDTGCVPFPIFRPRTLVSHEHHKASGNLQMSAVLVPLVSGDFYLSAGDAEGGDEISIMKWANQVASSSGRGPGKRILKISHHGSDTSSSPEALKLFHPDFAVISAGLGNRYGHPTAGVLNRLSEMKIPVHRTDLFGPFRAGDVLRRPPGHHP
jgi:competence protein ComEC